MSDQESIVAIQQRMRDVRGTLSEEVVDLMASTRDMTNWRKYVRANPWICLAAAAVAGYAMAPKRAATTGLYESDVKKLLLAAPTSVTPRPTSRLRSQLISFVSHAAMRAFMGYVGNRMAAASMPPQEADATAFRRTSK